MRELSEADLRVVISSLSDFVVILDEDGCYSWVNRLDPSLREEDVIGKRIDTYVMIPEEKEEIWRCAQRALSEGEAGELVTLGYREGEYETWYWCRVLPLPPDERGRKRALLVSRDETKRVQAQKALSRSEERFRRLVESSPDFICILDANRTVTYANKLVPGVREDQIVGQSFDGLVDDASHAKAVATVEQVLRSGEPAVYESSAKVPSLASLHFRVQVVPWSSDEGAKQVLLVATDVTQEHRAAELQRVLCAELDHRVKNTLALVAALASQTARGSDSLDQFQEAFIGRLRSLATTHEALAAAGWRALELRDLVHMVVAPLAGNQFDVSIPSGVEVAGSAVTPVALALHELTTNASKYGGLASSRGHVRIEGVTRDRDDLLVWTESGVETTQSSDEGFGLRLVRRLIEQELGGHIALTFLDDGRRYALQLPRRSAL